jgi:hypothetical protein
MAKVKVGTLSDSVFERSESRQVIAQSGMTRTSLYHKLVSRSTKAANWSVLQFPMFSTVYFVVEF